MKFTVKGLIFLGIKTGMSPKTQKEYCLISLLTPDNNVVQCFIENMVQEKINQFDRVDVEFRLTLGKNSRLTIIDIKKSE